MRNKFAAWLFVAVALVGLSASDALARSSNPAHDSVATKAAPASAVSGQPQIRYRQRRITPQEARRLQRQRAQLIRQRNRVYRDGYVTRQEQRRLQRKAIKYRRHVQRARRN